MRLGRGARRYWTGRPVVYRCYDGSGRLLYIGYTSDAPRRMAQHEAGARWWAQMAKVRIQVFRTPLEAAAAERDAIRAESPAFNIQHTGSPAPDPSRAMLRTNGRAVRALREAKGVRHGDMAKALGISAGYLSNIERGRKQPACDVRRAIADFLTVPLDAILDTPLGRTS